MQHPVPMSAQPITFAGQALSARATGALWWASERLLCVADLHFGKAARLARRGGVLLPPYETAETLDRLAAEVAALDPAAVVCLGDSFDDPGAPEAMPEADAARLAALIAGRDWVWITGNHDPGPVPLPGRRVAQFRHGPLVFRHEAETGAAPGEVSGHYHPKYRLRIGGRSVSRACFLHDARRLILPAFGAYVGGLRADHPALAALFEPPARAILTGAPCVTLPFAMA